MSDTVNPSLEPLVTKEPNPDPEYQKLMSEYTDNPFHDITKAAIEEHAKKVEEQEKKSPETPVAV